MSSTDIASKKDIKSNDDNEIKSALDSGSKCIKIFVPDLKAFEAAEQIRENEKQKVTDALLEADLKLISDAIKNHPGIKENRPDDLHWLSGVHRKVSPSKWTSRPIWYVKFPKPVSANAFSHLCHTYKDTGFFADYAGFSPDDYHIRSDVDVDDDVERACVIWKLDIVKEKK